MRISRCTRVATGLTDVTLVATAAILTLALLPTGCATKGRSGALIGGGIGALAGQAFGGDTEGTLIGAAVGTGIGYIIGNEQDKEHARKMERKHLNQQGYTHNEVGPLGGTRWKVISLVPKDRVEPYSSRIVAFRPDGRVISTTTKPDGTVEEFDERYRVVGKTLIVNMPGG